MLHHIDAQGWLNGVRHYPTPFYDQRPDPQDISLLVLHNISLPPNQFGQTHIDALFHGDLPHYRGHDPFIRRIRNMRVSAHFFIARDGCITQYASTLMRAWHAGQSSFNGRDNCNDFAIGIELNGADHIPYTQRQYSTLARLSKHIMQRHPRITPSRITTHAAIAPERKTDPGAAFNHAYFQRCLSMA